MGDQRSIGTAMWKVQVCVCAAFVNLTDRKPHRNEDKDENMF